MNHTFILGMSEILYNIYIWVVLVNSESVLVLAFLKYMLYSHRTQSCIFLYFWRQKPLVLWRKIIQNLYIFAFILSKNSTIDSRKTSMLQEWMVVESCLTPCWITFFKSHFLNALSTGVQCTLSFQWTNFGSYILSEKLSFD